MAVTKISSCRKQAGRESNRYRFHLVLFLFYQIYNSRPGVTLVADHIYESLQIVFTKLGIQGQCVYHNTISSQPCIIKHFLIGSGFWDTVFLQIIAGGDFLFLHQKGAIIRGRWLLQILLTRSRALNICSIFSFNKKIITSDKRTLAFKVFQIWFLD